MNTEQVSSKDVSRPERQQYPHTNAGDKEFLGALVAWQDGEIKRMQRELADTREAYLNQSARLVTSSSHEPPDELLDVHAICDERDEWRRKYQEQIPDGWTIVPKEADDWIAAHIPALTASDARDFYRRLVAAAELSGGASLRVRNWSCNSESSGYGRCVEWCKSINNCPASVEVTHRPSQPPLATGCHRSHPHDDMSAECERLTEIARENNRRANEPKSGQCEVCAKPLPPVAAWSMPSCPDCQELLEGLGQLMGDFADREQTIKADWIGRAIDLICARTSQPPADEQLPSAWIKGHTMHTDAGLEYDEEVVPGSDRPNGDGWHPLYSRPPQPPESHLAIEELKNLINAKRFDRYYFANDTEFAEWALSRARYTLGLIERTPSTKGASQS